MQSLTKFTVDQESVGQRLDNFLLRHLKKVPKSLIYRLVRKRAIRVNQKRVKHDYRVQENDIIAVPALDIPNTGDNTPLMPPSRLVKLLEQRIVYQDDKMLIINKPSGLAVHGGSGLSFGVIELLRAIDPKASFELVHRIDKDTSGCLMIAKRRSALRNLHAVLRDHKITKEYTALVMGHWKKNCSIQDGLRRITLQSGERIVTVDNENGDSAHTKFKLIKYYPELDASLVMAQPITGRTHQIRVHAQHHGHPLAGDPKYGDREFDAKMKAAGLKRLFLHATRLICNCPDLDLQFDVTAPLDPELTKILPE